MKLQFKQKIVYGKILFYPVNQSAIAICAIAGRETMDEHKLKFLAAADFEIEVTTETVTFSKPAKQE